MMKRKRPQQVLFLMIAAYSNHNERAVFDHQYQGIKLISHNTKYKAPTIVSHTKKSIVCGYPMIVG
jgi:hypothetical protein